MNNPQQKFDILVVGAGMIGAATALGLAQEGWRVALLEHQPPAPYDAGSEPDIRVSAISCASVDLLKQLGAWKNVLQMRSAPYRKLETWEQNDSKVTFDANSLGLPELGYMVENRILQLALWQEFERYPNLTLFCPTVLKSMQRQREDKTWRVMLEEGTEIDAHLIIGADGARSQVRQLANIGSKGWQYRQSCMLITVKTEQPQQDTTWQQFFPSGPRAFLPLFDQWASLVWYDSPARIRQLQSMTMVQLEREISKAFPARLGKVAPIAAGSFPLVRHHASHYVQDGLVLLGDAAHTINPLAGQGVNLGYRDVDVLLKVLTDAKELLEDWHSQAVLMRYQRRRMPDNLVMQAGMDLFHTAFSNDLPGLKTVRNLTLMVAQRSGVMKNLALKYALGL
ncbi:2-octaprenyl-3-methyl-6-methoxy-1,4-benzoquinol hydroxylase [Xenorhabdus khoisanae]|uniref:2-octaprenyl-3-methyl-6-methoxy-1,4-benzoquinol hydroxylase n=1 Tax=Xenorhabdus khoisanae TaxID=880157 RepID=A0A0J5ISS0_9GAMM|nr:3-demethoxyubiquinol 3-hydroxylase [Xenorhabdus khoisanae]KMJ46245.1 2-octaprenyl-3-methyl-6-methoxy-1,4-benzoquinol hydroxylase [Xenorhabdus khoisanae]